MGSYYYLGAQIPYLVYGQNPPMSSAAFRALALEHMSSADLALMNYCTLDPDPLVPEEAETPEAQAGNLPETQSGEFNTYSVASKKVGSSLINRWKEWERTLRLNLAKERAIKFKRESLDAPDTPPEAVLVAKNALLIESPLEAELFLDKARWDAIDNLQGLDVFSDAAMYAYLLKLLLMERRVGFNAEDGFTEYKELYNAILNSAESSMQKIE